MRRVPPHSRDSEESVLGGVLFHGRAFPRIGGLLEPSDFYDARHEKIFEAMVMLSLRSTPIDIITVAEEMRRAGTMGALSHSGSEAYLAGLANSISSVEHLEHHAAIVRDKATRRKILLALGEALEEGYADQTPLTEYFSWASERLFAAGQHRQLAESLHPISNVLQEVLVQLDERSQRQQTVTGVPTGFAEFDDYTAGLQPSEMIILAARPSMGKTAFALNTLTRAALDHGIPSLVFSVEMSRHSLVERMLSAESQVPAKRLRIGRLNTTDWVNLTRAASGSAALRQAGLAQARITLSDDSPKLAQLCTLARRWHMQALPKGGLGLIVVDYLQLLPTEARKGQNRNEEVRLLSQGLKNLAKELRVPIVVLSQLSRNLESRPNKRPMCSDLRDSGAIEQDADVVAFLYREWVYNKEADPQQAELIIGKQRNGETGTIPLRFEGHIMRFVQAEAEAA